MFFDFWPKKFVLLSAFSSFFISDISQASNWHLSAKTGFVTSIEVTNSRYTLLHGAGYGGELGATVANDWRLSLAYLFSRQENMDPDSSTSNHTAHLIDLILRKEVGGGVGSIAILGTGEQRGGELYFGGGITGGLLYRMNKKNGLTLGIDVDYSYTVGNGEQYLRHSIFTRLGYLF